MSCDLPQTPLAMSLVRPTWADPQYMLATNDAVITHATFPNSEPARVIGANPRRWAIGFVLRSAMVADLLVSPWPDVRAGSWVSSTSGSPLWFTVFEYGPLVNREWWAIADNIAVLRMVEIVIN